jgi:PAS domain S-box-containing protein
MLPKPLRTVAYRRHVNRHGRQLVQVKPRSTRIRGIRRAREPRARAAVSQLVHSSEHALARELRIGRVLVLPPLRLSWQGIVAAIAGPGLVTAIVVASNLEGRPGPGLLYLLSVVVVTYSFGFWAGLLSAACSFLGYVYFVLPPGNSFSFDSTSDSALAGVIFVLTALVIAQLVERLRLGRLVSQGTADVAAWGEARYGSLLKSSADVVWHTDERGQDLGLSPLWLEYTGQGELEARGAGWLAAVHPKDRERVADRWSAAVASSVSYDDEYRLLDRNGIYRIMSVRGVPVRDDAGGIREWIGVSTDISARRRAEELLRARARQQLEAAELGRLALSGVELRTLFGEAVKILAETLEADEGLALELLSPGDELVLYASHGWGEELIGQARAPVEASWGKLALDADDPVISDDLHIDARFRMSPLLRATGAVSAAGVRVGPRQAPWGVVEVLSRTPRRFSEADTSFLTTIANVLTAAVGRRHAEDDLRASQERLKLALHSGQLGTWEWNVTTGRVEWSEDMEAILGLPEGFFDETFEGFKALVHPDDQGPLDAALAAALSGSEPYEIEFRFIRPNGTAGWIAADGVVIRDNGGRPLRMVGLAHDVTARKQREVFMAVLAEASEVLQSLDSQHTLTEIARLAVPRLADCCIVDVVAEADDVHQLQVIHVDPEHEELIRELESRYPSDVASDRSFVGTLLRERRPGLVPHADDVFLAEVAQDDVHLVALKRLGLSSVLAVPLIARGRALGVITLLCDVSGRHFGADDLSLCAELARHAALAVDNARLYEQRTEIASTLQRSLLPPELPRVPGIELAARYRAAGEGLEVGGDFYDAFTIEEATVGIAIGDVCGKGVEAAAVTGLARHTIRAAALRVRSPAAILAELNEAVLREHDGGTFCTVVVGVLEAAESGGARLTLSSGGHPLPLILLASGEVTRVGTFGTLVGVFPDPELEETTVELAPGDTLVLFTDGLVEGFDGQFDLGEMRLARELAAGAGLSAEEIAARVEQTVDELGSVAHRDDIAFLVLRVADR